MKNCDGVKVKKLKRKLASKYEKTLTVNMCYKVTKKTSVKGRPVDLRDIDNNELEFLSKPGSLKELKTGNYDRLVPEAKKYISKLKRFNWNKDYNLARREVFDESLPQHLVLKVNGEFILVDTQGFDHVRYAVIIRNLPNPEKGIKDIFKNMCTPTLPEPPCEKGRYEKKRPNGATCCYKGK